MQEQQNRYFAVIYKPSGNKDATRDYFKFRKKLFVDELGWDLEVQGDLESDSFDSDAATYCSLYLDDKIVGGFRMIPTNKDYLGLKHFPQLASSRPYPQQADIWEVSRLGVLPIAQKVQAAEIIYSLMVHFVINRSASALIAVMDEAHRRRLPLKGMKLRDFGPLQLVGHDKEGQPLTALATEMLLHEQGNRRFTKLLNQTNQLEVHDETLFLRRTRISA